METIEMNNLTPIQKEIYKAIKQLSEKNTFTEFIIAKKIRENLKFDGKKKAGISLGDLLIVLNCLNEEKLFFSIHINSVNECLLRKESEKCELPLEAKQRRQKSEKNMIIFTSNDVTNSQKNKSGKKSLRENRTQREKLSVYDNYED